MQRSPHLRLCELHAQRRHALLLAAQGAALPLGPLQGCLQLALLALQGARLLRTGKQAKDRRRVSGLVGGQRTALTANGAQQEEPPGQHGACYAATAKLYLYFCTCTLLPGPSHLHSSSVRLLHHHRAALSQEQLLLSRRSSVQRLPQLGLRARGASDADTLRPVC